MLRSSLAALVLASATLAPAALAQTTYRVAPKGFESREAGFYSDRFGIFPDMRLQWAEGELGNTARTIKGIGFRRDSNILYWPNHGRTYRNVKVRCAGTDHTSMSRTWTANWLSTPALVYDAALSLPTDLMSRAAPAAWSSGPRIAFKTPYVHRGSKDLLLDITMTGGTMHNRAVWTSYRTYPLDAPAVGRPVMRAMRQPYGNGGAFGFVLDKKNETGCRDSRSSTQRGPYVYTEVHRYAPTYGDPRLRGRATAFGYGNYLPPRHDIAVLRGVPNTTGVAFPGVTCNKVYLDLRVAPSLRFVRSESGVGSASLYDWFLGSRTASVPFDAAWTGLSFMTQGAFRDTVNGSLRITQATATTLPALGMTSIRRMAVWNNHSIGSSTGFAPSASSTYFPLIRYAQ